MEDEKLQHVVTISNIEGSKPQYFQNDSYGKPDNWGSIRNASFMTEDNANALHAEIEAYYSAKMPGSKRVTIEKIPPELRIQKTALEDLQSNVAAEFNTASSTWANFEELIVAIETDRPEDIVLNIVRLSKESNDGSMNPDQSEIYNNALPAILKSDNNVEYLARNFSRAANDPDTHGTLYEFDDIAGVHGFSTFEARQEASIRLAAERAGYDFSEVDHGLDTSNTKRPEWDGMLYERSTGRHIDIEHNLPSDYHSDGEVGVVRYYNRNTEEVVLEERFKQPANGLRYEDVGTDKRLQQEEGKFIEPSTGREIDPAKGLPFEEMEHGQIAVKKWYSLNSQEVVREQHSTLGKTSSHAELKADWSVRSPLEKVELSPAKVQIKPNLPF